MARNVGGTITYLQTDRQGTPVRETNPVATVTASYRYEPYGSVYAGPDVGGPGYTGHEHDPETGFVYMQARYGDVGAGWLLSPDPVYPVAGDVFNFSRYPYANDNPYKYTDPDGRDCKTVGKEVTCSEMVTGSHIPVKFSFPAPAGFPAKIDSSQSNYHHYDIAVSGGAGSANKANAIRQAVVNDPTPGVDKPATPNGTQNNESPQTGILGLAGKVESSPVESYTRTYQGNQIVVGIRCSPDTPRESQKLPMEFRPFTT